MTLIIGVFVPTGIVISGDSRTTSKIQQKLNDVNNPSQQILHETNITLSDSTEKVFKLFDKYGVATFGDALINNLPIAHYVEQFEAKYKESQPANTEELAKSLLSWFRQLNVQLRTGFLVSGYDDNSPYVYSVDVFNSQIARHNFNQTQNKVTYGIVRSGDVDIVNRLLNNQQLLPPFDVMSLQDAVDFSRHLIRATIDQLRFEPKFPTVGGEIDTLVITYKSCNFLIHKQLRAL